VLREQRPHALHQVGLGDVVVLVLEPAFFLDACVAGARHVLELELHGRHPLVERARRPRLSN
jgi:hypothetical protein